MQHPITITVSAKENWLEITNNKKEKKQTEQGEGLGLQNISRRYKLLTNEDIIIINDTELFTVKIPLT